MMTDNTIIKVGCKGEERAWGVEPSGFEIDDYPFSSVSLVYKLALNEYFIERQFRHKY